MPAHDMTFDVMDSYLRIAKRNLANGGGASSAPSCHQIQTAARFDAICVNCLA